MGRDDAIDTPRQGKLFAGICTTGYNRIGIHFARTQRRLGRLRKLSDAPNTKSLFVLVGSEPQHGRNSQTGAEYRRETSCAQGSPIFIVITRIGRDV
jgi:hypothetical protein